MSVAYRPVGWTRSKLIYDAVLIAGVVAYLMLFRAAAPRGPGGTLVDAASLDIKAYGTCAFLLLTFVLAIGPLARLDRRFLPLLYNRRHFGIVTCTVALAHAKAVLDWYFAFSPLSPFVAMLASETGYGHLRGFPFVPFGVGALLILLVLALTSHDFWLKLLTPPVWKRIHGGIYVAYAFVVTHVTLGALQDARNLALPAIVAGGSLLLVALHLAAAIREGRAAFATQAGQATSGWIDAGEAATIPPGRSRVITLPGGVQVAIFRDGDAYYALNHLCAHQNGPLGEGKVRDGCVICPWHGYEYRLRDGRAPPPFTERVAVYELRLEDGRILIEPKPRTDGCTGSCEA